MGLLPRALPAAGTRWWPARPHPRRLRAACQAFPAWGRWPLSSERTEEWVAPGEAEAGPSGGCPRRALPSGASLPHMARSLTHSPDRCGEVMLPRAGPKPRQTRDGDVHGERGFSSRSACGPLASPLPPVGGGGEAGVRTPARPRSPVPCGVGGAGVLRRGRHSRLLACSASCLASGPPPRRGRAAPPPRHVPPRRGVSVSRLGPLRCPWSAPGCPSGARGRAAASLPVPSESSRVTPAVVVSPERLS